MTLRIIDTHCHLNHERLYEARAALIDRAREAGVTTIVNVGFNMASSLQAVEIAEEGIGDCWAVIGVHPHDAAEFGPEAEAELVRLAQHPRVAAIGEIGLDYYRDLSPRDLQERAFRAQIRVARECELPVVIHCREAYADTLAILADEGAGDLGGVMHCWAGTAAHSQQTVAIGLALGIGGTLTFKNAANVRSAAADAPLESLLLETDAPYLAPTPHRGEQNEPAYTRLVAERLAELRGLELSEIARLTTANALRVFSRLTDSL